MAGNRDFEVFPLDSEAFQARLGAIEGSPPAEPASVSRGVGRPVCGHPVVQRLRRCDRTLTGVTGPSNACLSAGKSFDQLIAFLSDEMDWAPEGADSGDLTFEHTADKPEFENNIAAKTEEQSSTTTRYESA